MSTELVRIRYKENGQVASVAAEYADSDAYDRVPDDWQTGDPFPIEEKAAKVEDVEVVKEQDISDTKKKEIKAGEPTEKDNIRDAVLQLEFYNNDHWTASGEPKMIAVETVLGYETTRRVVEEVAGDINRDTIRSIKGGGNGGSSS